MLGQIETLAHLVNDIVNYKPACESHPVLGTESYPLTVGGPDDLDAEHFAAFLDYIYLK